MVQDALLPNAIRLALSDAFRNKDILPPHTKAAYGNSFQSQDIAPQNLITHVTQGKAFTMGAFSEGRTKETFTSGQVFGLDLDNNVSMEDCLSFDFIRQYAYLIYPTPSSGKPDNDGNPIHKSRVLFIADAPVPDRAVWERLQRALMWHCNILSPDDACKDAARLFFGSQTNEYHTQDVVLPLAHLEQLADAMEAEIGTRQVERTEEDNNRIREQNRRNLADDKAKQRLYNYAAKALDNMVSSLSSLAEGGGQYGGRNNTLNIYAAKAGNLIATGMISQSECESALRGAALSSGLSSHEIDGTLQGGIAHGMNTPTDTDALEEQWQEKVEQWKKERQQKVFDIQQVYEEAKTALPAKTKTEPVTDKDVGELLDFAMQERLQTVAKNWLVYNDGYYMSWWQSQDVPLAYISAMLNLTETRSSTAWVLIAIHHCMMAGHLSWALFSVADVVTATGMNRALVKKAFIELERGGYVRFLKTDSLYNIVHHLRDKEPSQETVHHLTRHIADYYTPSLDINAIRNGLLKMLKRRFTEKYGKRGLVTPSWDMAAQMGIEDKADYDAWVKRFEAAKAADDLTGEAARLLHQEFETDGHNWHGWERALKTDFALPIDWKACESIKDVRGQILKQFIALPRRDVNSQHELCRLLGCSSATLSDVMRSQNIATIEQTEKIERRADFHNLDTVLQEVRRDKRGMPRFIWFREKGETAWLKQDIRQASLMYARNRKRIHEVSIQVVTPSKQKVMTPEEIEVVYTIREKIDEVKAILKTEDLAEADVYTIRDVLKRATKAARAARMNLIPKLLKELDSIIEQYGIPETEPVANREPKQKRQRQTGDIPLVPGKEHLKWTEYKPKYLYKQTHKQVFMFTPYQLVGNVIFDDDKNVIFTAENYNLKLIYQWLREQGYTEMLRNSYEYHGIQKEDYTPEIKAHIKAYLETERKALEAKLNTTPTDSKVIQMPLDTTGKTRQDRYPITKWIGNYGLVNEIRGDDLYVDGFKQVMSERTWLGVEQEIQTVIEQKKVEVA
jgi:DNA-binding transcriptional regulator YhcF (GntR family)